MSEIATRTPQEELVAQIRGTGSKQQIAVALKGSGIAPEKFVRVAVTAINENAELVNADHASLFSALMRCAQDGLLPDGREAALVIFNTKTKVNGNDVWVKKAQYMPMIGGLRRIAAEYGWSIFTACVYANDEFDPDLETQKPNHRPTRLGQERGDLIGVYASFQHRDGRRMLEVMDVAEVEKIRNVSRAKDRGPWVDWYEEMAQIRPVRRGFKKLPLDPKDRERIDRVIAATDLETGERVELLYGNEDSATPAAERTPRPTPTDPPQSDAATAQQAPGPPGGGPGAPGPEHVEEAEWTDAEAPFEGEEPPPVTDEPPTSESEPTFTSGRYSGKTIAEVYESGADGLSYVKWAVASWKTEPLRAALDRFAETHPDVKA